MRARRINGETSGDEYDKRMGKGHDHGQILLGKWSSEVNTQPLVLYFPGKPSVKKLPIFAGSIGLDGG